VAQSAAAKHRSPNLGSLCGTEGSGCEPSSKSLSRSPLGLEASSKRMLRMPEDVPANEGAAEFQECFLNVSSTIEAYGVAAACCPMRSAYVGRNIPRAPSRAVTQIPPGVVTSNSSTLRSELSKP
jgi:hypothetical protein